MIATTRIGTVDAPTSVFSVDIDGDGRPDVLSSSEADNTIAWFEQRDPFPNPGFIFHSISTAADGAQSVHAADLDGDGDKDVVSASGLDNTIAW